MKTYTGKSIFNGIAIGKVKFYQKKIHTVVHIKIDDIEAEVERFNAAKEEAIAQLSVLYEKAVEDVGR